MPEQIQASMKETRSGAERPEISGIVVFLDSEYQDSYAAIADCLGRNTELEKPFPILKLQVGDLLLKINGIDVRRKTSLEVKRLIADFPCNQQAHSQQTSKLLVLSFVKAENRKDSLLTSKTVN